MLLLKLTQANQSKTETDNDNEKFWIETDKNWICQPCIFYSKDCTKEDLVTLRRGNFGCVNKTGQNYVIVASKTRHNKNLLHKWCVKEHLKESEHKVSYDRKNEIAARIIIRNVLLCFKRDWGSVDFLALNEVAFLTQTDIASFLHATKNDSRAQFFRLRNVVFDVLAAKTKNFFSKDVENIAVTLDKVTVSRVSFTVILTYYFHKGKIHIILNKLQKLSSEDYDGIGTANMLISTLCETLGMNLKVFFLINLQKKLNICTSFKVSQKQNFQEF